MRPIRNAKGTIVNAAVLTAEEVAHESVLCPACADMVFAMWPEGWDAHAEHKCAGVNGDTAEKRKADLKEMLKHLFR